MAHESVSDDMVKRVQAFKPVFEAVLGEPIEFDLYIESLLGIVLDYILRDLQSAADQNTLLKSFQQLAGRHPAEVYGYIANMMKRGEMAGNSKELQRRIGFHSQSPPDQSGD